MRRGARRTSYVRDGRGRFASTPGGGTPKRPPVKRVSRGTNRLTRDNSGRITSVGGNGATARGGRLRTGAGNLRARQTDRLKGAPQGVLSRGGKARGKVAAPTPRPATRQRVKPPIGTPRKGQVARALARAEANMQRGSAAVDKAQGRNNRNISRASAEAGNFQLSKPGSAEARKAKAAYDRLNGRISKGEKTRTTAANAGRRLRALERAMTRGYGPTIAKAKVRVGANKSLLESAPGDRIKGGRQRGTIAKPRGLKPGALAAKRQKPTAKVDMKQAISRAKELRQQASKLMAQGEALMGGGRRDGAIVNVPLGSRARQAETNRGIRGSQLVARAATLNNRADRVLERAVASRKKAEREAAKPAKAPRSAESLRLSRAKQVEKRRSITTNPAGNRADAAGRMAANAARTQQRALAFYGGKPKKKAVASRSAATSGLRPGELMNANARPVGTMAKPPRYKDPYETTGNWWKFNVMTAQAEAKKRGAAVGPWTSELGKILQAPGAYNPDSRLISFNSDSPYWRDPAMVSRMSRFTGHHSSANPLHTVLHEIGHQRDKASRSERVWRSAAPSLARRVSKYATTNRAEFVAEVYAGIQSGMKFDYQVMRAYRQAQGLSANPPARRRSRLRRPRKP